MVLISITPFAPRIPQIAVAEASLRNDVDAISVVKSGLNYARQLFDSIYELAGNEESRSLLKQMGSPTPLAEKYLQTDNKDINHEREDIQ